MTQRIVWILWPAFVVAAAAEMFFFAFFDPGELRLAGDALELSRTAVYSLFFFFFWALGACSSALTCLLQRSPFELNRCPLDPAARPAGCPKRASGCDVASG
jgi:hypothetical protein